MAEDILFGLAIGEALVMLDMKRYFAALPFIVMGCAAVRSDMQKIEKLKFIESEIKRSSQGRKCEGGFWTMAVMTWDKAAYDHALSKLKKVKVGMSESDFYKILKIEALTCNGKKEFFANGWFHPLVGRVRTEKGYGHEHVFGYIENGVVKERMVVVVEEKKVARIQPIDPKKDDDGSWEGAVVQTQTAEEFEESFTTKEAFRRVENKLAALAVGMNQREMFDALGSKWIEILPGRLLFICDGFIRSLYEKNVTDSGEIQKCSFGYSEEGKQIVKYEVLLRDKGIIEIKKH